MSKYLKDLNSDEKKSILEQYSKFMISEQSMGTGGYTPDYEQSTNINKLLTANSFKTGLSDINQGPELDSAMRYLYSFSGKPIKIIGGASAVGSDRGYDNKGLATKRAQNLINFAKEKGIDVSEWLIDAIVGKETKKGAGADAEQFVGVQQVQGGPKVTTMKQDFTGIAPKPKLNVNDKNVSGGKTMTIEVTAGDPRFLDELKYVLNKARSEKAPGQVFIKYGGFPASFGGGSLKYFG